MKQLFNDGWQFFLQPVGANMPGPEVAWQPVDIPHDWLIYNTQRLYEDGDGWYRKTFTRQEADVDRPLVFINFDGVYMDCVVYVNHRKQGEWKYGYTPFAVDCTEALTPGLNEIMLHVSYRSPNSRWYSGAGIYRDVHIITKKTDYFPLHGIYITPRLSDKPDSRRWQVEVDTETHVRNGQPYTIIHTLKDTANIEVARSSGGENQILSVDNPCLWDIETPYLYTLISELVVDGIVTDIETNRMGFRTVEMTPDRGFFLNGQPLKLNGVCQHHDLGALGAAINRDALKRQLTLLRAMGVNAIRTAHNPPAAVFMELADEMGFLVVSELLDMWERPKTTYDYARYFNEWVARDAAAWIRRDRNSPSIIMWSVGNEIYDTHADTRGRDCLTRLMDLVRQNDPKGHAPATLCSNYMPWPPTQACADIIKLIGYNYAEALYEEHHTAHPDWIIYGSETGSTVQSRGVYHFPHKQSTLADDDMQCSALGNSTTSWGAKNVEAFLTADRDAPFSLGQFLWSGFDYIGEPTPYFTKNAYFGHIDTAGFPKDTYYLIQSAWTDYRRSPMVHIFPHWDHSPGQVIDVRVCSNAPKVALFLNGRPLGTADIDHRHGQILTGDWEIPYEQGVLEAYAYDESGYTVACMRRYSFGDAYALAIKVNSCDNLPTMTDGPNRLLFIEITSLDANGVPVENANNRVTLSMEGGRIMGMDNGDSTDYDAYKTTNRRMFNGKLLAMISPFPGSQQLVVTAESPSLCPARLTMACVCGEWAIQGNVEKSKNDEGTPYLTDEIPVRKIELTSSAGPVLGPDAPKTVITAVLRPHNADYRDIVWRLADRAGIDSPLASLSVSEDGLSATVAAKGDGEVYVRCGIKNGGKHPAFYTYYLLRVTGMGQALLNPYDFVSGGLYSRSNRDMTNGNERGVATPRDGESHVGFSGLDFGPYGSDELTLPLFPLSGDAFPVEVWEGMPEDGGQRLCVAWYDLGSVWNTFQNLLIRLPRRLTGVTTLCFVLKIKVHIKGFIFKKYDKAYQQIHAAEYDAVYGDAYTVNGSCVEQIGNNVTLVYNQMDFGTEGASQVEIKAASLHEKNSVLIVFTGEDGIETKIMLEIPGTASYNNAVYPLRCLITGLQTVSFVFLPGSHMDLAWFQFL